MPFGRQVSLYARLVNHMTTSDTFSGPTTMAEENREPPSDRTKQIAKRLRRVRESRAMSQREFGRQLGVSPAMMNNYEQGERRVPSDVLAEMAEILECSADELMGLTKAPRKYEPEMPPEVKALWKKFQLVLKLPEHDQRAVIRLINSVSKTKAS